MEKIYIQKLEIKKVRHLVGEKVNLCEDGIRHLIITGKNGSGKTSVLDALSGFLDFASNENVLVDYPNYIGSTQERYNYLIKTNADQDAVEKASEELNNAMKVLEMAKHGLEVVFNVSFPTIKRAFQQGEFVLAYYKDERKLFTDMPKHVEKVALKDCYSITEQPRTQFVKYLLDMKMTEALAAKAGKDEKANRITEWFLKFEKILREIYMDESIKLDFDEETFEFHIIQDGKEPFGFNELSRGFAAILDIVIDLMLRMEKHMKKAFCYDIPGIVLIDEIETHLHLELQKKIMDVLTRLFPNIQFIVSTHSPFILNSITNTTIYDLEKRITVQGGLHDVSYDGIVESYFNVDRLSDDMRNRFERYKELTFKEKLSDEEIVEISELEMYLSEIPDYLMLDIATEFQRCKAEFEKREDI